MDNNSSENFKKMNTHLLAGDFEAARAEIVSNFEHKPKTPVYYYNLGIIDLKQKKFESAWIHLGMAETKGSDPAITQAVQEAEVALEKAGKTKTELDPATDSLLVFADTIPLNTLNFVSSGLFILLFAITLYKTMKKTLTVRFSMLLGLSFMVMLTFLSITLWVNSSEPAWVLKDEVAKTGPGENFLEVAKVSYGTKVRVVKREKSWIRIRMNRSGLEGYIPESSVLTWDGKSDNIHE